MLRANRKKISKDLDGAVGGLTNESRWYQTEEEKIRSRKRFNIPALTTGVICTLEQGWNRLAIAKDVIRFTINYRGDRKVMIFNRKDFEQAVFAMAQEDEVIKYIRGSAEAQRKHSELPDKKHL